MEIETFATLLPLSSLMVFSRTKAPKSPGYILGYILGYIRQMPHQRNYRPHVDSQLILRSAPAKNRTWARVAKVRECPTAEGQQLVGSIRHSASTDLRFPPTEKKEGWSTFRHRTAPSGIRSPTLSFSAPEYPMTRRSPSTPDEFRQQEDRLDQCSGQRRQPYEECSQILCCGLALASIPRLSLGDPLLQYVA